MHLSRLESRRSHKYAQLNTGLHQYHDRKHKQSVQDQTSWPHPRGSGHDHASAEGTVAECANITMDTSPEKHACSRYDPLNVRIRLRVEVSVDSKTTCSLPPLSTGFFSALHYCLSLPSHFFACLGQHIHFITMRSSILFAAASVYSAAAQQFSGTPITGTLPLIDGAELAFWKITGPDGNDNHTLINYQSLGLGGGRINNQWVKRAVIVIHGLLRDPWDYEQDMLHALTLANSRDNNINKDAVSVVAPYFPSGADKGTAYPWVEGLRGGRQSITNALVWSGSQWSAGGNNQYPHASRNISSYHVLDEMIRAYLDASQFPEMRQIVLVGHSLGGQMLQRYAVIGEQLNPRIPITYWVGNPDSYSWMSPSRPLYIPDCPDYDNYRDGYTDFAAYGMTYGTDLVAQGEAALEANFQSRQIAYARATQDLGDHSSSCGANTTGQSRNERFFFFLKWWTPSCPDPKGSNCDTVDFVDAPHDNGQMFNSTGGQARLFTDNFYGDGARAYDQGYPRQQAGDDPFPDPKGVSYTTTPTGTYAAGMAYQGCWSDDNRNSFAVQLSADATTTIESCTQGCANTGWKIAALENANQCWCANTTANYANFVVDSSCWMPCSGNVGQKCGGHNRASLFSNGFPVAS
jgi:pimeloyl-ACP methyl ester carboxylesterase